MAAEARTSAGASLALHLALAGGVIVIDQLTKLWIVRRMVPGEVIPVVDGWFQLRYIVNRGGLFGLFRDLPDLWRTLLFTGIPLLASAGLLLFLIRTGAAHVLLRWGLALILGGAVGNLSDRLRLGHVVDFLDAHWRSHHWPAFNVADSAICIGVGLILLDAFRDRPHGSAPDPVPGADGGDPAH